MKTKNFFAEPRKNNSNHFLIFRRDESIPFGFISKKDKTICIYTDDEIFNIQELTDLKTLIKLCSKNS